MASHGESRPGVGRQGKARRVVAWIGPLGRGVARQAWKAWQGLAWYGKVWYRTAGYKAKF